MFERDYTCASFQKLGRNPIDKYGCTTKSAKEKKDTTPCISMSRNCPKLYRRCMGVKPATFRGIIFQSKISVGTFATCPHVFHSFTGNFGVALGSQHDFNSKVCSDVFHHSVFIQEVRTHCHKMAQTEAHVFISKQKIPTGTRVT